MELFAADGHDAGGCERVTGKSGMRPGGLGAEAAAVHRRLREACEALPLEVRRPRTADPAWKSYLTDTSRPSRMFLLRRTTTPSGVHAGVECGHSWMVPQRSSPRRRRRHVFHSGPSALPGQRNALPPHTVATAIGLLRGVELCARETSPSRARSENADSCGYPPTEDGRITGSQIRPGVHQKPVQTFRNPRTCRKAWGCGSSS